jgi:hypothetical protein
LQVQGQPRLCGKALSQKKSNNNRKPYDWVETTFSNDSRII